jgi:endonuclease/exonuclease/phosphatase family metal-dependent hydrolase
LGRAKNQGYFLHGTGKSSYEFDEIITVILYSASKMGYKDCWKLAGGKGNEPSCWTNTRIDYIFANEAFLTMAKPVSCKMVDSDASDHKLVTVTFQFYTSNQ